ncbi:MAG: hypothetical protein O9256_01975 [Rhizobiaceae bacterium]|nr:hypothetical protein [Rhizobiaceae bacterium]
MTVNHRNPDWQERLARARRKADARRRERQPYRKLFDHIRQGCRLKTPHFSKRMTDILGYGYAEFRARIEETFEPGMTWELFLAGDVCIGHVVPLAAFPQDDVEQVRKAWSLANIKAAWPDNLRRKLFDDHRFLAALKAQASRAVCPACEQRA